jgi:integrase/recombinase XerD
VTPDEQLEKYLKKCLARGGCGQKTVTNYRFNLLTFLQWWENEGHTDLLELTDEDIDDYILYLQDMPTINHTTVNNKLRDLRAFLRFGHTLGWCPKIDIKLLNVQEPQIIPLSDEQLAGIYDACLLVNTFDRYRDYTIMRLFEETGIRLHECLNLTLLDVDMKNNCIKLNQTKNKKAREVYLTPAMKKDLNLYLEARQRFLASKGIVDNHNVWIVTKGPTIGQPVASTTIQARIRKYSRLAGIPIRVSPHTFRHTFARNFLMAGGDVFTLQELLGHSTLEMVRRYVRLFGRDRQNNYLKTMKNHERTQIKKKKPKY